MSSSSYSIVTSWALPNLIFLSSAMYTSPHSADVLPISAPPTESGIKVFATETLPAKVTVELATVELGVIVTCVTYVPAEFASFPNVIVPPSATLIFHSSPASSPWSAFKTIGKAAPSTLAAISSASFVDSS